MYNKLLKTLNDNRTLDEHNANSEGYENNGLV